MVGSAASEHHGSNDALEVAQLSKLQLIMYLGTIAGLRALCEARHRRHTGAQYHMIRARPWYQKMYYKLCT